MKKQQHPKWSFPLALLLTSSFAQIHTAQAAPVSDLPACSNWSASETYTKGYYAVYANTNWRAKWWTKNNEPGKHDVWEARPAGECTLDGSTTPKGVPTLQEAQADEVAKTSSPLFQQIKASVRTLDAASVEAVTPGRSANPVNVKRVERLFSSNDWHFLFPMRDQSYSYVHFLQAIAKFPAVCDDYTDGRNADAICRKGLATMFAHFVQETGAHDPSSAIPQWQQGLLRKTEGNCRDDDTGCGYNAECNPARWEGQTWVCGENPNGTWKKYYGRGAKQLSYNFNYGLFSDVMFGTVRTLLDKPELVADTWLNLASAVFFYVYPQPPKPSMLHVIDGTWKPNAADAAANISAGFGATINIINGGVECNSGTDKPQAANRISYYKSTAKHFAVPIASTEALSCATQKLFPADGGAQPQNWEQDSDYDKTRLDGKTYACKLVSYQTPFIAFKAGDYVKCVEHHFKVTLK